MDKATKLAAYRKKSERIVHQRVKLIPEPSSEQALATQLANTEIGKVNGTRHANFAIVYDVKLSGESVTKPHLRPAPFRKEHAMKCVAVRARCNAGQGQGGAFDWRRGLHA